MADETIKWPEQFELKENPDYDDYVMGQNVATGSPVKFTMESIQAAAGNNVIGAATPTDSPSGTETDGQSYRVVNSTGATVTYTNFLDKNGDPIALENGKIGYILKSDGAWVLVEDPSIDLTGYATKSEVDPLQTFVEKSEPLYSTHPSGNQLFNKSDATKILSGKRFNQSTYQIEDSPNNSILIAPVEEGKQYSLSGFDGISTNHSFDGAVYLDENYQPIAPGSSQSKAVYSVSSNNQNGRTLAPIPESSTVPPKPTKFVGTNVVTARGGIDTFMFVEGTDTMPYEDYTEKYTVDADYNGLAQTKDTDPVNKIVNESFESVPEKNLIDLDKIDTSHYYSPGSNVIKSNTSVAYNCIVRNVEEGKVYAYSGTAAEGTGGFLNANGDPILPISMSTIVNGFGFMVTEGIGVKKVVLNINNTKSDANLQLEQSDVVTEWKPFKIVTRVKESALPPSSTPVVPVDNSAFTQYQYPGFAKKYFPKFMENWLKKAKDLVFAVWGTSLLARTNNTTYFEDAPYCCPLGDSNNLFGLLAKALNWEGQKFRRYDAPSTFTETGTFTTTFADSIWDDGSGTPRREGRTRFSKSANASVKYTIPAGMKSAQLFYRTDAEGDTCTVSIGSGSGKARVKEEGGEYAESNGFSFSMLEPPATDHKGNTTFGKYLRFDIVDTSADIEITISKTADTTKRLSYWGISYSPRDYMITFINAARGSNNFSNTDGAGLPEYMINELIGRNPDMILCELPTINEGASFPSYIATKSRQDFIDIMHSWTLDPTNEYSLYSQLNGFENCELVMFNDTASTASHAIDETTKEWVFGIEKDTGEVITCKDIYDAVSNWGIEQSEIYGFINVFGLVNKESVKRFGSYYVAFVGSGKTGSTFSIDGTHWNDFGTLLVLSIILGIFDFN